MKIFSVILMLLCLINVNILAIEPDKKPKTDAMLFGDVKDGETHIPFATIILKGTTIGTAADATGHFKMINLPIGKQVVLVSAVGYKTREIEVNLVARESVTILVQLDSDNIGLEQVVVSANRNEKSRRETATVVNTISAKLFNRTQNVTLSEGLNFTPGLRMENNCQNCGFTQVRMNGLEGPYSQILINSRPIFSGLAGVYGLELIPSSMIDRVEIIRGGGSAMYGSNAIAGTINLITKDPISDNFAVASGYGSVGAGTGSDPAADFTLNLNGSFVTEDYKTGLSLIGFTRSREYFDVNGDGYSEISELKNSTLGARFYQRVANRGKITIDYFNINEARRGGNKFDLPMHEAGIAEGVTHRINSGAANFEMLLRESDKLSIFFAGQGVNRNSYYGANQDLSAYGNTTDFTYTSGVQYIRLVDKFLFSKATITSGFEFNGGNLVDEKLGYYDVVTHIHNGNTLIADQLLSTQAGFLQSEWKMNKTSVTIGARFDHYRVADKTSSSNDITGNVLSPRFSLLYNIVPHLQFRAGFARGFRAPQIFDEDLHIETSGSRKVLHQNDPNLTQETSNSFSASLDFTEHLGEWQFQLLTEGFYTKLMNPFVNKYGTPDPNGTVIYTRVNAKDGATVKGINIELNGSPSSKLQLQSGFTFQNSKYEKPREFGETHFFRSPNTYGYIGMDYNILPLLKFSATGNYTGSMLVPYFGPSIAKPEEGELHTTQSFFDAGVKMAYQIKLSEGVKMEINGGVKNLFNSYQNDFDLGIDRDPAYMYGPLSPRTIYFGIKFGNLL